MIQKEAGRKREREREAVKPREKAGQIYTQRDRHKIKFLENKSMNNVYLLKIHKGKVYRSKPINSFISYLPNG